jgi:opacity protein-like surface antigen
MLKKQKSIAPQIAFGNFQFHLARRVCAISRWLLLSFFLFCAVSSAAAQSNDDDRRRAEFFAGYSVMRTNYEAELPNPPMPVVVAFDGKQTLNGLNVSATGYLAGGFGLTGDFSAHFKTNRIASALGGNIETGISVYNVTGGPQYKFRNNSRVTPFVRALAGVAVTRAKLEITRNSVSDTSSSTDFALTAGGGVDVRVNDRLDLRIFQADYNPVFLRRGNELGFGESRADNVRFSFGVVFK